MPRKKKSIEEKRETKKLAERRRMAKIRADPDLYSQWLAKSKEHYQKNKQKGLIVPISELTPKQRKIKRQKNRKHSNRYQQKKRVAKLAEIQEPSISFGDLDEEENHDPLSFDPPPSLLSPHAVTKNIKTKQSLLSSSVAGPSKVPIQKAKVIPTNRVTRSTANFKDITNCVSKQIEHTDENSAVDNYVSPIRRMPSPSISVCTSRSSSIVPETPQSNKNTESPLSDTSYAPGSPVSRPLIPKRRPTVKKSSPWKTLLKKMRYRTEKELQLKDQKIIELKRQNERIVKQLRRLQKQLPQKRIGHPENKKKSEPNPSPTHTKKVKIQMIKDIEDFFTDDEVSRMTAGKKEFVTRNKIKKQKRLLNDNMHNLHKKFLEQHPLYNVSYSFFCKLRNMYAFWAVALDAKSRETCLCKEHENMDFLVLSLKKHSIIKEKSTAEVLMALTCDPKNLNCLTRSCNECKDRHLDYKEFDNSREIEYFKWITQKKIYTKNGHEMKTTHTLKKEIQCFPKDLIENFENSLNSYMSHVARVIAQMKYVKKLKVDLKDDECFIHCDYSENYGTKYATEIQSFHFGGSRQQITLHTVVIYFKKDGVLQHQCFCTISESLRHDAVAVWEHLLPVFRYIETTLPEVESLYFLSDSPSGQYRNRKMFYIIGKLHWNFPSLRRVEWNYSERGHGKGAPDGVGGTIKRTADKLVAQGSDIPDMNTFVRQLKDNISGIILDVVHESGMLEKEMLIPTDLKEFRGTMTVHQVVWCADKRNVLAMRKLSCQLGNCAREAIECVHGHHMGFFNIENNSGENVTETNRKRAAKKTTNPSLIKRTKKVITSPTDHTTQKSITFKKTENPRQIKILPQKTQNVTASTSSHSDFKFKKVVGNSYNDKAETREDKTKTEQKYNKCLKKQPPKIQVLENVVIKKSKDEIHSGKENTHEEKKAQNYSKKDRSETSFNALGNKVPDNMEIIENQSDLDLPASFWEEVTLSDYEKHTESISKTVISSLQQKNNGYTSDEATATAEEDILEIFDNY